jgi:signal transduction histidine kinase/DNA-binding response OmpR family regulator
MNAKGWFTSSVFFTGVCVAGYLANSLSLQLSDVTPLLLGLIAPMLLTMRLGVWAGALSLWLVMLPLQAPLIWLIAMVQLVFFWPARYFQPLRLVMSVSAYWLFVIFVLDYHKPTLDPLYLSLSAFLFSSNFFLNCAGAKMLLDVTASKAERSRQTLQHQLASRIAAYSAVPASFLILAALHGATVLDLAKNNANQLQLNQQVSANLSSQLTGFVKQLELTRQHLDKVSQDELLRELVKSNPAFISALRTDANGIVMGFYKEFIAADIRNTSVAHREYFSVPKTTLKPMVSNVFRGQQLGKDLLFAVSVPLFYQQKFAGVLEVSVSLERLTRQFTLPQAQTNYQFVLIDGAQLKLWGQDQQQTALGQQLDLERNQLVTHFQLYADSWFNPVQPVALSRSGEHMLQQTTIAQTDWSLLQYSEMAQLYLRYEFYQALAQLTLALMVLLMRYSSRQFVRSYTETLSHVIHSLERLAPDQTQIESISHRASAVEFDELQHSFNRMQRRISQAHRQIQQVLHEKTQLSDELELRVQARTRELANERDKANELALIKSRFLANMSHELRTPLSIIQGYAGQMHAEHLSAIAQQQLKSIQDHSQFLLHIVNDILDTAKIDEGKLRLDPTPVDLPQLFIQLASTLQLLTSNKGLKAELQIADNLPQLIVTDSFRLQQILMNLISNAVKFTQTGFVRLQVNYQAPLLIIQIADSGAGISEEQQQRIFQAFEQADVSTTRQFGGTGLGLYICQRLAELLDATLSLQSKLGEGSTFSLTMPVTISSEAPAHNSYHEVFAPPQALANLTILIVDDVAELRTLFQSMLLATGAHIIQAANGDDALNIINSTPVDLLLLDMHMPVRDGLSTLKALRLNGIMIPVIALTADVQPQKQHEILAAGGQQVLTKPVDAKTLIAEVYRLLLPISSQTLASTLATPLTTSDSTEKLNGDEVTELTEENATAWDELQTSFVQSLEAQLYQLQHAATDDQMLLLHKLKGTAACLEFGTLSQLALLAETQLKEQQECQHELEALSRYINALLHKHQSVDGGSTAL